MGPGPQQGAAADLPDSSRGDAGMRREIAVAMAALAPSVAADPWRCGFHVQPQAAALSDPVGMVHHDGVFHLCHLVRLAGFPIFWVHLTSTDLVHWSPPAIALAPGDAYDSHGCYSGSAVVRDGRVNLMYTGNVRTPDGGRIPTQCLATQLDDGTFAKHPANPVIGSIPQYSEHQRDPHVWAVGGSFLMVLGVQTLDQHGALALFSSADLQQWRLLGQIAGGAQEPFGYMWECPGLVQLIDREEPGSGVRDVLIVSPQFEHGGRFEDRTCYAVGRLSLDPPRFEHDGFHRLESGPDFYAPRTMLAQDGRTIVIGWMGMPVHPGEPSLAEQHPSVARGWVHCLSVPRTIELSGGRLAQWPVAELDHLHGRAARHTAVLLVPGSPTTLPGVAGERLDLFVTVDSAGGGLVIGLREGPGQVTRLTLDPRSGRATLDREAAGAGAGGSVTGGIDRGTSVSARILVDSSSVEVFVNGGLLAMSARIYPDPQSTGISFTAVDGDVALAEVTCYPMGAVAAAGQVGS